MSTTRHAAYSPLQRLVTTLKRTVRAVSGLRHWRVHWKLVVVVVGPTLVAVVLAVTSAFRSWGSVADFGQAAEMVRFTGQVNELVDALQQERDVTAVFVASGRQVGGDQVTAARKQVDASVARYRDAAAELDTSGSTVLQDDVRRAGADLDGLSFVRDAVSSASLTEGAIRATYSDTIASLFAFVIFDPAGTDSAMSNDLRVLGDIFQIKEQASQARAELGAILATGTFTIGKLQDFTGALARQRAAVEAFQADATEEQRLTYADAVQGKSVSQVQTDETTAIEQATAKTLTIDPNTSFAAATEKLGLLQRVQDQLLAGVVSKVDGLHDDALFSAWIAIGTLALVVVLAVVVSAVVARSMSRSLRRLRSSAMHVAEKWLPDVTARLRHTNVEAITEVHVVRLDLDAHDEIGEVARSFDAITAACAQLVREQAELRGSINSGFINLARRNQACADRILHALDEWEHEELDADRLHRLFVIDHLATRMRRTDDSLMIIAGAQAITKRTNHSSLDDVISAALSEVEHYTRVNRPFTGNVVMVTGRAVPDVVHLLAELLDNATTFSPPESTVTLAYSRASSHPDAVIVTMRDHGVGMTPAQLADANQRIVTPEAIHGSMVRSMGLIVVGRLAARHGIAVQLRATQGGGVTATVVLPGHLFLSHTTGTQEWHTPPPPARQQPAIGPGTQPSRPPARLPEPSPFQQVPTHPVEPSTTGSLHPATPVKTMGLRDAVAMRRYQRRLTSGDN